MTKIKFVMIQVSFLCASIIIGVTSISQASPTDVVDVKVVKSGDEFRFDVTLKHDDSGWDHYANKWEIIDDAGQILGTRVLAHPHVNEQPFTRSLGGIVIGEDIKQVTIRAVDNLNDDSGKTLKVTIRE